MNRLLIVANFKSNLDPAAATKLVGQFDDLLWPKPTVEVVLAPTTLCLTAVSERLDRRRLRLASQTGSVVDNGPYTGEVSFAQLAGLVDYSLVGHSERRLLGETDDQISDKARAAVYHRITPIICVGETKTDRVNRETGRVLSYQVGAALANLTGEEAARVVIAYEPVWALSDGHNYNQTQTPTCGRDRSGTDDYQTGGWGLAWPVGQPVDPLLIRRQCQLSQYRDFLDGLRTRWLANRRSQFKAVRTGVNR